jgi:hypothetical protein
MKNLTIITFLALLSSFVLLVSCASENRQRADAIQFYRTHPQEFATFCNDKFPPELKYIQGKSMIKIDTLIVKGDSIPCKGVNPITGFSFYLDKVKAPDAKIINRNELKVDTFYVENTKRVEVLRNENNELSKKNAVLQSFLDESISQCKRYLWIIVVLGLLIFVYLIIRFKSKIF